MDSQEYLDRKVIARLEQPGPGFSRKLISLFLEQTPRRLDSALAGVRAKDWKAVENAAHSLKSSAGNVGAMRLRDQAERVEAMAASGQLEGRLDLLAELERTYAKTKRLLMEIKDRGTS